MRVRIQNIDRAKPSRQGNAVMLCKRISNADNSLGLESLHSITGQGIARIVLFWFVPVIIAHISSDWHVEPQVLDQIRLRLMILSLSHRRWTEVAL